MAIARWRQWGQEKGAAMQRITRTKRERLGARGALAVALGG